MKRMITIMPKGTEKTAGTTRRSTRTRNPPKRFEEEVFLPGSNNGYTAGREIDSYDRDYEASTDQFKSEIETDTVATDAKETSKVR